VTVAGYRPWLDGVRGFSILLVIVEHLSLSFKPAWNFGGTGVGIFFVLSGYLITGLLLAEFEKTDTIALKSFYLRRAARLVPALLLVVLICDPIFLILGWHKEVLASFIAMAYLMNYATLAAGHYLPAYGHTWSLAVEEHFYLLWPLVLMWLLRRRSLSFALRATLVVCVVVLLWRVFILSIGAPPRLAYVGSFERADTLLFGCAAAIATRQGWRPKPALFFVGLALVVFHLTMPEQLSLLRASLLGIGTALMLATLDYSALGSVKSVFSFRPLVWLGSISYGVYLWHGAIFHILWKTGHEQPIELFCGVTLALTLSWLSYRYVEVPIRDYVKSRSSSLSFSRAPRTS
jgi:peptidoglycan/LPS O-acetylase OafA/YrhL